MSQDKKNENKKKRGEDSDEQDNDTNLTRRVTKILEKEEKNGELEEL